MVLQLSLFQISKAHDDRMYNLKSLKGRGTISQSKKPTSGRCGKKYMSECLVGTQNFFNCGKSGHKIKDFPNVKVKEKGSG